VEYYSNSEDESDHFEQISGHSSKCFSPKPNAKLGAPTKENTPPGFRPGKKSVYSSVPSSPARPIEKGSVYISASAPCSPLKPAGTPDLGSSRHMWKSASTEQSLRREMGAWKVKSMFEMPKLNPDGHSEMFVIEEARKQLKKTRSVLRPGKNKLNQGQLSMRVLNLPVDRNTPEDKLDECLVKLFDGASGFKTKPIVVKGRTVDAFSGTTLVRWLGSNMYMDSVEAVQFAQTALMNRGVFVSLSPKHQSFHAKKDVYYQLKIHDLSAPLNGCKFHLDSITDPVGLSQSLVTLAIRLLSENRTVTGGISFDTGRYTKTYLRLCVHSSRLQTVNLQAMTPQERSAFYINVYNVMAIHSRFAVGSECCEKVERKALSFKLYLIAQSTWGPEDIMTSLRGVFSKGPGGCHPILPCLLFDGSSRSAPIRPYDAADFSPECMPAALEEYLQRNVVIDSSRETVFLPRIFKEFVGDFGSTKKFFESLGVVMESRYLDQYADTLEIVYHDATYDRVRYCEQ